MQTEAQKQVPFTSLRMWVNRASIWHRFAGRQGGGMEGMGQIQGSDLLASTLFIQEGRKVAAEMPFKLPFQSNSVLEIMRELTTPLLCCRCRKLLRLSQSNVNMSSFMSKET